MEGQARNTAEGFLFASLPLTRDKLVENLRDKSMAEK
jgi:hypothetical protein